MADHSDKELSSVNERLRELTGLSVDEMVSDSLGALLGRDADLNDPDAVPNALVSAGAGSLLTQFLSSIEGDGSQLPEGDEEDASLGALNETLDLALLLADQLEKKADLFQERLLAVLAQIQTVDGDDDDDVAAAEQQDAQQLEEIEDEQPPQQE
ncbi:hypothetical protein H696_02512 [Fonticula alba]|uniref:Uncharacterized protein n=1 Tax=Fonticula alba TaxID=691883 RepID=A0A058ZDN1_FONAL|nr:hypothetical protein H696_02512 [Fonticula alba]KCV71572.1 hypothetical protein H696_02512 [Fonticula alba]|eukprot:XP_009494695.1 hypothetical protein H696_02512 [Fonticula alba]